MLDLTRRGNELTEHRPHRPGAEQPRLLRPARMEDARREDMPTLLVCGELHLVDGEELDLPIDGHGLDGGHPVRGARRDPLLLPRDERDAALPDPRREAVVDLAREQPQR